MRFLFRLSLQGRGKILRKQNLVRGFNHPTQTFQPQKSRKLCMEP
jgi:hypothetical protein